MTSKKQPPMGREQILKLAERATRMAGEAHRRGDFLACARHQDTAFRYRRAAYAL